MESTEVAGTAVMTARPWGSYTVLEDAVTHKVKRIVVNPGQRLSLQSHEKRDEEWIIVSGSGSVLVDDTEVNVAVGSSVSIKRGQKHRIQNHGGEILVFIEVQRGDYFGEDDIVRYSDDYGRSN